MPKYNLQNLIQLREAVYYSNIHDASIASLTFDPSLMRVAIVARNTFFRKEIRFIFPEIKSFFSQKGNRKEGGSNIFSLTIDNPLTPSSVSEDTSNGENTNAMLFFFEMFSGNEIQIISECVDFEVKDL